MTDTERLIAMMSDSELLLYAANGTDGLTKVQKSRVLLLRVRAASEAKRETKLRKVAA